MTLLMCAEIIFAPARNRGELRIYRPNSVKIESGFKYFTNTATIILPRNAGIFYRKKVTDLFASGDPVSIKLGYNGNLIQEFEGYVSEVTSGIPVEIRCENEMYMLKRGNISISQQNTTVKKLLQAVAPGYEIDCPDMQIGSVRFPNHTPIKILEQLKQKTGLQSYFDGKILRCGVYYADQSNQPPINIVLEKNAIQTGKNRLTKTDVNVTVKAISLLKDGKKIDVTVGDKNGTLYTLTYAGIEDKATLEKNAKKDYERIKAGSLDGGLELFGIPCVQHGQRINLKSLLNADLDGVFYADKVVKEFSDKATYRQKIELSSKINNEQNRRAN